MAHDQRHSNVVAFLENHPRMMGALFTVCTLLVQAGNVAANAGTSNGGP